MVAVFVIIGFFVSEGAVWIRADGLARRIPTMESADVAGARSQYGNIRKWAVLGLGLEWRVNGPLRDRMLALAEQPIADYRSDSQVVREVRWRQAAVCIALAADLSPGNARVESKRKVIEGHLQRIRATTPAEFQAAIRTFQAAAALDPASVDPYLGLARIHAYNVRDVDALTADIKNAEARGYRSGPRERGAAGRGDQNACGCGPTNRRTSAHPLGRPCGLCNNEHESHAGNVPPKKRRMPGTRIEALLLLAVTPPRDCRRGADRSPPTRRGGIECAGEPERDGSCGAGRGAGRVSVRGRADVCGHANRAVDSGPRRHRPRLGVVRGCIRSPRPQRRHRPLLTGADLTRLRPALSVRSAGQFRWKVLLALSLTLGPMWLIHLMRRRWTGIGDPILIPGVTFLLGIGLMAMFTLRDPIRDGDIAISFATGVCLGAISLMAIASVDVVRIAQTLSPIGPALLAFALAGGLLVFGHGPAGSGAKVNLFGVQPGELVRVLAVAALALYLGRRWELIRGLSKPIDLAVAPRPFYLPRPADVRPLLVVVGTLLVSFFLLRDLGPALVLGLITLALYGIARGRVVAAVLALVGLVGCFAGAYALGAPATIVKRVAIWMDPWQNALPGGDQIAHALWAMATGSAFGLGPGAGEGRLVPAGHTDLVITVLGEELGYIGLVVIVAVYVLLVTRMIRMSAKAPSDITLFLAVGCTLCLAVPAIVVTMGVLGLMPLSGIATPFLSYGKTSMVCNLALVGVLLSIRRRQSDADRDPLPRSMRGLKVALAVVACAILARAFFVQVIAADEIAVRASLVQQADGTVRYQYNPRLLQIARRIPRGTIFDRNGLALATEDAASADQAQARLKALGLTDASLGCAPLSDRCYPLGTLAFHVVGDALNRTNWSAPKQFVRRARFEHHPSGVQRRSPSVGRHAS